ncbi:MAG: hypothetical protein LBC39_01140 [Methanobrevibacter sp.]|jgi:hypothetical protein|nr:hypothetical protein [Candidatus Methanovirga aequatorialis]
MNEVQKFIHNTNQIIVDTELMVLLLAGWNDHSTIKKIKATKKFSAKDHDTLTNILKNYSNIKTTSHILAEFSNLNNHGYYRKNCLKDLKF